MQNDFCFQRLKTLYSKLTLTCLESDASRRVASAASTHCVGLAFLAAFKIRSSTPPQHPSSAIAHLSLVSSLINDYPASNTSNHFDSQVHFEITKLYPDTDTRFTFTADDSLISISRLQCNRELHVSNSPHSFEEKQTHLTVDFYEKPTRASMRHL